MPATFNHISAKADVLRHCGSIATAAAKIGIDRTLLSRILNGNRPGSIELAHKISDVTGEIPYRYFGPEDPRAAVIEMCRQMGITAEELDGSAA